MSQWISVDESLPENKPGLWSSDVIAMSDEFEVFRLSCMDGYWQRTRAFIESGSTRILYWMPMPELP